MGAEAVELARMAGLVLDPWQAFVLEKSLGERRDGKWSAFEVGLVVARQNGKGAILEARELAGLFLLDERLILHSAHEYKTAHEGFLRIRALIDGCDQFRRRVKAVRTANGEQGIELKNGARLRFVARTKGSGRGFSGDCLILDEAMELPESAHGALLPTLSARPNPQVWYTGSAVDKCVHDNGVVLTRIRERGLEGGDPGLAYFEFSAESPDDPDAVAQANPGLGIRISAEHVDLERRSMDPHTFAVERMSVGDWPSATADKELILPEWPACEDQSSQIVDVPVFAPAVSVDRRMSSIGVCGGREDGLEHLEVVQNGAGTGWIVPTLVQFTARNGGSVVVDPSSPAGTLLDDLKAAGVRVHTVGARDYAQACGWVFDGVAGRKVRHLGQQELSAAVSGTQLRTLAGGFAWDLREPLADVTPLVAVTLACWGHRTFGGNLAESVW